MSAEIYAIFLELADDGGDIKSWRDIAVTNPAHDMPSAARHTVLRGISLCATPSGL